MSKKIVIIPVFCESHLIKFQVPNIIDTIDPDIIIYNEGMFPRGPESNTNVNNDFIKKYTLDGIRGFDFNELEEIINKSQKQYPDKKIILNKMNYDGLNGAPECYYKACSNFDEKIEGRHRKICIRYGTPEFYKDVILNFMTQNYPMLYPTDLVTYHYAWWRPGKFKELRYDQLNRPKEYWDSFEKGIQEIIQLSSLN